MNEADWYSRIPLPQRAENAYRHEYDKRVGSMNRKARRTLQGRLAVAEAHAAALEAKLRVLEEARQ